MAGSGSGNGGSCAARNRVGVESVASTAWMSTMQFWLVSVVRVYGLVGRKGRMDTLEGATEGSGSLQADSFHSLTASLTSPSR